MRTHPASTFSTGKASTFTLYRVSLKGHATLANAFSHHIRQDSKEGRKREENAREQGVRNAQKLQERKILEQQEELRRQEEQKKLISEIKQTTQVLELQVAAV